MKFCKFCGQPMKPKGVKKRPNEYDHASGCPASPNAKRSRQVKKQVERELLLDQVAKICRLSCEQWLQRQRGTFDPIKHSRCIECTSGGCNYELSGVYCACWCHDLRGAAHAVNNKRDLPRER